MAFHQHDGHEAPEGHEEQQQQTIVFVGAASSLLRALRDLRAFVVKYHRTAG
jgi:hypothetical protein